MPTIQKSNTCIIPCDPAIFELSDCSPCEPIGCVGYGGLSKKHKQLFENIEVDGWLQAGFFTNSHGTTTRRSQVHNSDNRLVNAIDADSGNSYFFGNVHSTDIQVNQIWLELKKEADGKHRLDWGFASGIFFGTDASFTQSYSDAKFDYGWQNGDYYTSIPLSYFQLAYGDVSVKVGKFETYIGYEALRAPNTIFYSHPYSFMIEPTTHSGILAEYNPSDKLQIALAYTLGSGGSFENAFDDNGFLGYFSYQLTKKFKLSYAATFQRYGGGVYKNGVVRDYANKNQFTHTFVASYDITDKLNYTLELEFDDVEDRLTSSHERIDAIVNYLTYKLNKFWSVGFRVEWITMGGVDYSDYTLGLTWQPDKKIIIRPEIRFDHVSDKNNRPFNYGNDREQFSGGITGIYMF
ncbi:MAG: porin [Planctomycetaceae bacterium]|nr:porin [Planctomycetaceae bacterium]